jgi:RND family efflux transporter MFP subunit
LLKDKAGSVRAVDEARAAWSLAQKTMEAAEARKGLLDALTLDAEKGELRTLEITSPEAGILRRLSATRGQTVSTGAALFEVVNLDTVWMRVPVYVGCLSEIESGALAIVGPLNGGASPSSPTAKPIAAPPSADALSSTVDLYYEISNREGALRPGERVGVTLALKGESSNLTAPWAAVLHDIHGVAWVYEKTADHVFQRRRVLVQHVVGDLAVLGSGPKPGTEIVVDGAAELFGTEFGAGK